MYILVNGSAKCHTLKVLFLSLVKPDYCNSVYKY